MSKNDLTPAQCQLLAFVSHLEAHEAYKCLSTTLQNSIDGFHAPDNDEYPHDHPMEGGPTAITVQSWAHTIRLLEIIHDIAVENHKQTIEIK